MTKPYELSQDEQWIINTYRRLNAQGKDFIRKTIYCVEDYPSLQMSALKIVRPERPPEADA